MGWCIHYTRISGVLLGLSLIACMGWDYGEWCGIPDVTPEGRVIQHAVLQWYTGPRAGFGYEPYILRVVEEEDSAYVYVYEGPEWTKRVELRLRCYARHSRGASPSSCDVDERAVIFGSARLYAGDGGQTFTLCGRDRYNGPLCVRFEARATFPRWALTEVYANRALVLDSPRGIWRVFGDTLGLTLIRPAEHDTFRLPFPSFEGDIAWSPTEDSLCVKNVLYGYAPSVLETVRVYPDTVVCASWGPGPDHLTVMLENDGRFVWMDLNGRAVGSIPDHWYESEQPLSRIRWFLGEGDTLILVDGMIIHPREGIRGILGPGCTGALPNR